MPIFILINIVVAANSMILAFNFFKIRGLCDCFLAGFLLFFAQIVLVGLFLGSIGLFSLGYVFWGHALILISLLLIYRPAYKTIRFVKPDIGFILGNNLLLLAFSVFCAFFLVKACINLVNPPFSPDSLQIHLAFPATWITSARLDNPVNIFGSKPLLFPGSLETNACSYYPINAQLFFAWLMLPLRNAFLADLGEAPFYIIGITAVYAILRKYQLNRTVALLSGFLWALIPNIFKQLRTASQIDVICAVLFLLSLNALLLLKSRFSWRNAIIFGISLGLFVGTKIINLIWLAALMPFAGYILYRGMKLHGLKPVVSRSEILSRHCSSAPLRVRFSVRECIKINRFPLSRISNIISGIILMTVLFGGYMYIKNYFCIGNPVFPVDLKIFGKTIFKGLLDNAAYKMQIASGDRFEMARFVFKEGLGVQFLTLILPGTFLPLMFYRYCRCRVYPRLEYLLLFATPLLMLILYAVLINVYVLRYLFPYLSMGLLTAVIFTAKSPKLERYFFIVSAIAIVVSALELANRYELIVSLLLSAVFFTALSLYKKQFGAFFKSKAFGKVAAAAAVIIALVFVYLNDNYDREEFSRYPLTFSKKESWQADIGKGWEFINQVTKQGARVAYTGRMEFYPLFGTRLKNRVKYISVNRRQAVLYNNPDGLPRKNKVFAAWRENLKKERIEYLFVALPFFDNRESDDPAKFPIEDEWALLHPEDFRLLFSNKLSRVYKVLISEK